MPTATLAAPTQEGKKRAFSYVRFSSADQRDNDSLRRQMAAAEKWAAENGYVIDRTLRDEAVSAFRGKNLLGNGPLATFIRAVEQGLVEEGDALLVESLDRLSRQNPWEAFPMFSLLINSGVTVVTLMDGKVWTREAVRNNHMAILESIFVMIRAHEESLTKSHRISSLWQERRDEAAKSGALITGRAPGWLATEGKGDARRFVVREDRADVVKRVWRMFADGAGVERIARALNSDGVPLWGNGKRVGKVWLTGHIRALLRSRAPGGYYTPHRVFHENGATVRKPAGPEIAGYFPAIVDKALFEAVQALVSSDRAPQDRAATGVRSVLASLCRCARCGGSMTRKAKGSTKRAGVPRLVCTAAKFGTGRCQYASVPIADVERAVLAGVGSYVFGRPTPDGPRAAVARAKNVLEMLDGQTAALAAAVADAGSGAESLLRELRSLADRRDAARLEIADARRQEEAIEGYGSVLDELDALVDAESGVAEGDVARANALLRRLFDAIVVDAGKRLFTGVWKDGSTTPETPF